MRLTQPLLLALAALSTPDAFAYSLWSTSSSYLGAGEFRGPGANTENTPLFNTTIHNMMFTTAVDLITPFSNKNGHALADGSLINDNVAMGAWQIQGVQILPAAVWAKTLQGEQAIVTSNNGEVVMMMDFALEVNGSPPRVAHLPFYGTTGEVTIPKSLQTQMGQQGVDQAGRYPSGAKLRGRIGDFNHDGWIDGTILTTGVLPLDSPVAPGQPFLMVRHFETDIPVTGQLTGDVRSLRESASGSSHEKPRS